MSNIYPVLYLGLFTSIVLVGIIVKRRLQGTIVATFPARIINVRRSTIWTYVGVFVPIQSTTLIIEGGREVKVHDWDAKRVQIGDTIWVAKYSTGQYRFQQLAD